MESVVLEQKTNATIFSILKFIIDKKKWNWGEGGHKISANILLSEEESTCLHLQ